MIYNNTAVIDCDSIIFTAFHPNKVIDDLGNSVRTLDGSKFVYTEKTEEECKNSCDSLMNLILTNSKAESYIGYVKGKDTTTERLKYNPDYKSNRPKESPKYWKLCKDYLIENWGVIEANGAEVDDYVNITRLALKNAYIVAIDKDLLSLRTSDMYHYNWRKNEWVEIDRYEADHKFWSDMIVGQSGDNISGIKGCGEKYIEKLFKVLIDTKYYTAVFNKYLDFYGEEQGINEFYKTYKSLKILDKLEGFVCPKPIKYVKIDKEENNKFKLEF